MSDFRDQASLAAAKVESAAAKIESKFSSADQSRMLTEAIDQMKAATNSICQALSSVGSVTADTAKLKFMEGKEKAKEISNNVGTKISEKPLTSVGIAFAAGWLVSRFTKS